jgi:hypothetical protein
MDSKKSKKISQKYSCDICDYVTSKKTDYEKHIGTSKHLKRTEMIVNGSEKSLKVAKLYTCDCGNIYKYDSGYYRHKKICNKENNENNKENNENNEEKDVDKLVNYLMKENAEFKQLLIDQNKQMVELAKNAGHNNNNTTNNNSFNLNIYLNETCKDALNIMDFVNQLQIGIKDLEETGRLGFANGISKIFIDGLKQIDINNRPVHCSDLKREILYIKNNNEWNKEDGERKVLTSAIKHVVNKNIKQIPEWTKVHPDFNDSDSKQNDKYLQIVMESMSGSSQEEANKNYNKIIKNIAKETVIEKEKCIVSLSS